MTTLFTRALLGSSVLGMLVLTGCGTDAPATAPAPTVTQAPEPVAQATTDRCYETATPGGVDYPSAVDCEKPHTAEVYAVLDMPEEVSSEVRSDYASGGALKDGWEAWARTQCATALAEETGVAELGTVAGLQTGTIRPVVTGNATAALTPVEEWDEGIRQTVCAFAFGTQEAPASVSGYALDQYLGELFPEDLRSCYGETDLVPCDEAHLAEALYTFDARANLGDEFAASIDPNDVTEVAFERLDSYCAPTVARAVGAGRTDVQGVSDLRAGDWDAAAGRYSVTCTLQVVDDVPTIGSLVGIRSAPIPGAPVAE